MRIKIKLFFAILLIFTKMVFAQNNLNQDWINKDLKIFNSFLPLFELSELNLIAVEKIDDINKSNNFTDLGLGYKKTSFYQNGGYTAIVIKLLLDPNELIIKFQIRISANINALNVIDEKYNIYSLLSKYEKNIINDRITLELENTNEEYFTIMINNFRKYFEIYEQIAIPNNIFNDYRLLIDPFIEDTYGYVVGYAASTPNSRKAIENIKKENNKEILMLIMASPSPVGRMYAIEALSNGNINSLRKNTRLSNILNKIYVLKNTILAGAGCEYIHIAMDSNRKINRAMNYIKF
jgi:hypothetical protein